MTYQSTAKLQQENQRLQAELTELRSRYKSLEQSEARYRQIFTNAPISLLRISTEGKPIEMNSAAEEFLGWTIADAEESDFNGFTDPTLVENGTISSINKAIAGETVIEPPMSFEPSSTIGEGQGKWAQGHYYPIRDAAGQVQEVVEVALDLTAMYEVQQKLAIERTRLLKATAQVANLLLRTPDYTKVLSDVVRILGEAAGSDRCEVFRYVSGTNMDEARMEFLGEWCNKGISPSTDVPYDLQSGFPCREAIQLYEQNIKGEVANFGIDDLQEPLKGILQAQGTKAVLSVPIAICDRWWGAITFDNCGKSRLYDEAEIAILQVAAESIAAAIARQARDEELRESERRYRTLFELSNEGIYRFEVNPPFSTSLPIEEQVEWAYQHYRLAEVNKVMLAQYGMSDPQELIGKGFDDLYPEDSELNRASNRNIIENNYQIRNAEFEEIGVDGKPRYFLTNVVCDVRSGYFYGGWGTQTDITELREAQQALLEAEQERCLRLASQSQQLERFNSELQQTVNNLQNRDRQLQQRDRIMAATTEASNVLLTGNNLDEAVNKALGIIGKSIDTDRIGIVENFNNLSDPLHLYWKITYEWNSDYAISQINHPEVSQGSYKGIEDWCELFRKGQTINYQLEELPEPFRSKMAQIGVKTLISVPIFIEDKYWGNIGIDDCREETHRSEAELSILKTAAACIASAIKRDRTQKAILKAEQQRTQQLEQLNTQLQQTLERLTESEKRYRTLFEISSEGIYRVEFEQPIAIDLPVDEQVELIYRHCRIAEGNATYAAMYDKDNPEDLIGLRLTDVHVNESEQNQTMMRSVVENGYQIRNTETEEVDFNGNPRYFLNNITTIIENGYALSGWASQLDITELRLAQQALLQAEQERVAELSKTNQALKNSLDRLADEPDLDSFLGHVLTETSQQLQIDLGYLFFYDPGARTLDLQMQVTPAGTSLKHELQKTHPFRKAFLVSDLPIWDTLLETQKPFIIDRQNAAQYVFPGTLEWQTQQQEHQTGINILLTIREEPIGLLCLVSTKRGFSPQEIELAQALAQQATLAIQLTRLAEFAKQTAIIEERNQLAREIHDTLGQTFTAIVLQLEAGKRLLTAKPEKVASILSCSQDLAHQGIIQVQRSLWTLREKANEYRDLTTAFKRLVATLDTNVTVDIKFTTSGTQPSLPANISFNLLRIGQEALTNALKHASARRIDLNLIFTSDRLELQVRDDGRGFAIEVLGVNSGFGIKSIQQRTKQIQAEVDITSNPGIGTTITVNVPLTN